MTYLKHLKKQAKRNMNERNGYSGARDNKKEGKGGEVIGRNPIWLHKDFEPAYIGIEPQEVKSSSKCIHKLPFQTSG